ncbi:MAG: hypothetical protein JNM43_03335 [Planctomycetaceae bacterium]|nr:hypothetical protein [Planctomycetaceae bacterium]
MRESVGSSVLRYIRKSSATSFCSVTQDEKAPAPNKANKGDKGERTKDPDRARRLSGRQIIAQVEGKPDLAAAWDAVLRDYIVSDTQFAEAISQLHDAKKYSLAIEGVQSAIRAGRALPWMYDILALEMKLDNRPEQEIGRVLKSRIDFATANVPQMLITAAMLSRFEAWKESLTILKDASEINPGLDEIWLLARSVSDKSGDPDAIVWARSGVVKNVWSDGYQQHHDEARKAVTSVLDKIDRSGDSAKAQTLREQFADADRLDLEITVRWVGKADVDLAVKSPTGETCNYSQPVTISGGRLLVDPVKSDAEKKAGAESHFEKFVQHTAVNGPYKVEVRFISGTIPSGVLVVEIVQNKGSANEKKETKSIPLKKEPMTLDVDLQNARGSTSPK